MAECAKLKGCPFFNDRMQGMDGMASLYKKRFCTGDFSQCARWQVSQTGATVPSDLFPNQIERVADLGKPGAK
jgi:hypothetical protein